jgi:hypothetical protein
LAERRRGEAGARLGLTARLRMHAHGSWVPRAAAWPCRARGTGIPGPRHDAAAEGDDGCGLDKRRGGLLHKSGTMAGWERGPKAGPRRAHRRPVAHADSKG